MNFTDKNAGRNESTNKGKLTESNDYDKTVKSVGEFKHYFSLDHDEGLETLIGLGQTYIESYGLWMKWTRYVTLTYSYINSKNMGLLGRESLVPTPNSVLKTHSLPLLMNFLVLKYLLKIKNNSKNIEETLKHRT